MYRTYSFCALLLSRGIRCRELRCFVRVFREFPALNSPMCGSLDLRLLWFLRRISRGRDVLALRPLRHLFLKRTFGDKVSVSVCAIRMSRSLLREDRRVQIRGRRRTGLVCWVRRARMEARRQSCLFCASRGLSGAIRSACFSQEVVLLMPGWTYRACLLSWRACSCLCFSASSAIDSVSRTSALRLSHWVRGSRMCCSGSYCPPKR